jgi:hypothetical protein
MEQIQDLFTNEIDDILNQIDSPSLEPSNAEVEEAMSVIQRHLEREARNRQLEMLSPDDLCPEQKRDLVKDLARIFRV